MRVTKPASAAVWLINFEEVLSYASTSLSATEVIVTSVNSDNSFAVAT